MNCMKHRKEKPMKAEVRKKLYGKINEYMFYSIVLGHDKALEILKQNGKEEAKND